MSPSLFWILTWLLTSRDLESAVFRLPEVTVTESVNCFGVSDPVFDLVTMRRSASACATADCVVELFVVVVVPVVVGDLLSTCRVTRDPSLLIMTIVLVVFCACAAGSDGFICSSLTSSPPVLSTVVLTFGRTDWTFMIVGFFSVVVSSVFTSGFFSVSIVSSVFKFLLSSSSKNHTETNINLSPEICLTKGHVYHKMYQPNFPFHNNSHKRIHNFTFYVKNNDSMTSSLTE